MQYVEIELDPYETVIAEPGSFMMMDEDIEMKTIFGDGSGQEGEWYLGKSIFGRKTGAYRRKTLYDCIYSSR